MKKINYHDHGRYIESEINMLYRMMRDGTANSIIIDWIIARIYSYRLEVGEVVNKALKESIDETRDENGMGDYKKAAGRLILKALDESWDKTPVIKNIVQKNLE